MPGYHRSFANLIMPPARTIFLTNLNRSTFDHHSLFIRACHGVARVCLVILLYFIPDQCVVDKNDLAFTNSDLCYALELSYR